MQMVSVGFVRVDEVRLSPDSMFLSVCSELKHWRGCLQALGGDVCVLQDLCVLDTRKTKVALNEKDVDSELILEMFATVSFVYSSSAHVLRLAKYLDLSVVRPVSVSMSTSCKFGRRAGRLPRVSCHFVSCCDLGNCLSTFFFFCLDYYGMQLAAEPLPVYCPHPGPGIITDITRLFALWEPR